MAKSLSIREAAFQVLFAAKKPLHVSDITRLVQAVVRIESKTPENSVNNALQKDPRVERVGKGTYRIAVRRKSVPSQ